MGRAWTDADKLEQSILTSNRKIWEHSVGPISTQGKAKVSRNSLKFGYYKEVHREARKYKRCPEVRKIEALIRKAEKTTDNDESFLRIVNQIRASIDRYCQESEPSTLSPQKVFESVYLQSLVLTTINNSLYRRTRKIISELNVGNLQQGSENG
jgi:hypothetical protein